MNHAVVLESVHKEFGKTRAVDGLDIAVRSGELFGIVGPDGAGKTTTIRMIVGLLDAHRGRVSVLGRSQAVGASEVGEFIGYMPQQYSLYGDLSVWENMMFFGRLFDLDKQLRISRATQLLEMVGLQKFHARRADALSGGMYKKLALACALLHQPQLLVLDEPTNGVDPVSRRELWALLYTLVKDGMTVIVSTPDMDEASRCHRVALIEGGKLLALGVPNTMVSMLRHDVLIVESRRRREVEKALLAREDVFDCSPESTGLRVLVRGDGHAVRRWLEEQPGIDSVRPAATNFEDVYLALLHDGQAVTEAA